MKPTRKVSVSALSGAVVVLGLFVFNALDPHLANQVNNAVAAAAVVVVSTVAAYLIPEADQA
jgi:NADH:ubiquinone oxidoreductase subunit 6 (subunit J)